MKTDDDTMRQTHRRFPQTGDAAPSLAPDGRPLVVRAASRNRQRAIPKRRC